MELRRHPQHRRFLIILAEFFIVLKLYSLWNETTGFDAGFFFVLAFIGFWVFNWVLGKLLLGPNPQETIMFKFMPRMAFSNDWFGILVAGSIIFGFFFSKLIGSAFVAYLIIMICILYAYKLVKDKKNILKHSYGLVLLGFIFGMAFGNHYTSNIVVVLIFLIAMVFMYLSAELDRY